MMKKWLSVLLALVLVFALAACGRKNTGSVTNDQAGQTDTEIKDQASEEKSKADPGTVSPEEAGLIEQKPADTDSKDGEASESRKDSETDSKTDPDSEAGKDPDNSGSSEEKKEPASQADPADGGSSDPDSGSDTQQSGNYDPNDDSGDIETDGEFTGLDTKDEEEIVIGEDQGVGGF